MRRPFFKASDNLVYRWNASTPAQLGTPGPSLSAEVVGLQELNVQAVDDWRMGGGSQSMYFAVSSYERGKLLYTPSIELGLSQEDWDFLDNMPQVTSDSNFYKKAKMKAVMAPVDKGDYSKHVLAIFFPKDPKKAKHLQNLITRTNDVIRTTIHKMFDSYSFVGENITWRLTKTESEEIHYDSYGTAHDPLHHVRVFINLDDHPRFWGLGPVIQDSIHRFPEAARSVDPALPPNLFNDQFNKKIPWNQVDRAYTLFAPGSCWIVNSQVVAHEIIWGRKMIACTFDVDPSTMLDPERSFNNLVSKALSEVRSSS